ncbi:MAG: hypothetical protein JW973_01800 [Bacteroidales bacterium]|nr:hypothetical protein [Bacteroidales bacterium]
MKIKAILTGATGMVGEGVLRECLLHDEVEEMLVVGRRPCDVTHSKISEVLVKNFFDLSGIESRLTGYNTCFFCLGTAPLSKSRSAYFKITYTLTMTFAQTLCRLNPDMIFCYVSGAGVKSNEKGCFSFIRVKGKTENALMKLPFKKVYNFRPAFMQPTKGLKNIHLVYKLINWFYPVLRALFPDYFFTLREFGLAMIHAVTRGYGKHILEMPDLLLLSKPDDYKVKSEKRKGNGVSYV